MRVAVWQSSERQWTIQVMLTELEFIGLGRPVAVRYIEWGDQRQVWFSFLPVGRWLEGDIPITDRRGRNYRETPYSFALQMLNLSVTRYRAFKMDYISYHIAHGNVLVAHPKDRKAITFYRTPYNLAKGK